MSNKKVDVAGKITANPSSNDKINVFFKMTHNE